ncbi:formate/nitrite transporter family protein [Lysinibacillus telephonicus]|uniref:Formate/nitrite transporter family protein n=1 Tax=Lysinibacillus telephonicus TaxID=1714840 RepID=A0A3S0HDL9_9BACI|nr:formate/nitrite transporter family protein [Lysinibacillus telephonicus]RTQ89010.1 formate/nitrite transporter family protein [Lysinibacillus telephonicus]
MSYVKPKQVIENMIQAGIDKAKLPVKDMVIRGILSGALLGFGTTLAFTAEMQTKLGIVGALLFPTAFVIIILLGLELVTGNFALIPLAVLEKKATVKEMFSNWFWVIVGHLIGGFIYSILFVISITNFGATTDSVVAQKIIAVAEAKTLHYQALGASGFIVVFIKAILCNWMVTLGAVMAMTSQSTIGKIAAMWLPILIFFAQGFEHAVVNMFVIPAGMLLGANVNVFDWWIWNQIPVLFGNIVGGLIFTGLALYSTYQTLPKNQLELAKLKHKNNISEVEGV